MSLPTAIPHVLLLPGNMCDARLWSGGEDAITRAINACGLAFTCVDFHDDATITQMALRALRSRDGPLIPIGFSMGGIVALEMARLAQDRIVALALIDTTSHPDTRGTERLRQQDDVRAGHLQRIVTDEMKPSYLAPCHAKDTTMLDLLCGMAMDLGPDIFITQSEALRTRADLTPILAELTVPTIIASGSDDILCSPQRHREMAAAISNAQLHLIPDSGHILPLEQPHILARLLSQFLTTILGPRI